MAEPIAVPSQDIVLGCYYLTLARDEMKGDGKVFGSIDDVLLALDAFEVLLQLLELPLELLDFIGVLRPQRLPGKPRRFRRSCRSTRKRGPTTCLPMESSFIREENPASSVPSISGSSIRKPSVRRILVRCALVMSRRGIALSY